MSIEMNSDRVEPSLVLLTADGSKLAVNDDISPENFNAKIVVTLPEDGKYIVIAKSSEGETGSYTLQASMKNER